MEDEKVVEVEKIEDGRRICPLITASHSRGVVLCQKDYCAWWDSVSEQCCALSLSGYVADLRR